VPLHTHTHRPGRGPQWSAPSSPLSTGSSTSQLALIELNILSQAGGAIVFINSLENNCHWPWRWEWYYPHFTDGETEAKECRAREQHILCSEHISSPLQPHTWTPTSGSPKMATVPHWPVYRVTFQRLAPTKEMAALFLPISRGRKRGQERAKGRRIEGNGQGAQSVSLGTGRL
jgi:hypothetical protein